MSHANETGELQPEIIKAQAWISKEPPLQEPVLENWFDIGDKVCVIGGSKMHKTWFLLQMAICISKGLDFLGTKTIKARNVLVIQLEITAGHFHRRFQKVADKLDVDNADNLFFINGRGMSLTGKVIINAAKECGAEVVIIDPLYKLIDGDENTAHGIKPTLAMFDKVATDTDATVVYTHHDSKGIAGERDIRDRGAGSNVLGRDYDTCITLTPHRLENLKVIELLTRNYPQPKPFSVSWFDGLFSVEDADPIVFKPSFPNQNPTSCQPNEIYFPNLKQIIERAPGIKKTDLSNKLRNQCGLTKEKTQSIIKAAVESEIIYSNNGKGLSRKTIIFAPTLESLEYEMNKIRQKQQQSLSANLTTENEKQESKLSNRPF